MIDSNPLHHLMSWVPGSVSGWKMIWTIAARESSFSASDITFGSKYQENVMSGHC